MTKSNWHYSNNSFESATNGSAKKLDIIAVDHLSKLRAESINPLIAPIAAETEAPVLDFTIAYAELKSASGVYKGYTQAFEQKITELTSEKIKLWDIKIQNVHIEGTFEYTILLPNGRGPFQKGAYEVRIAEILALGSRLTAYTGLATLRTEVLAFHTEILGVRDTQQQKEGLVNAKSSILKLAAKRLTDQLYKNVGNLIVINFENPTQIERFYDLELIRSNSSSTDNDDDTYLPIVGTVDAGMFTNVLSNNFSITSVLTITNTGSVPILFYLTPNPLSDIMPPTLGIEIGPNSTSTHPILEFGAAFSPFLNAKNITAAVAGSFEVMIS